MSQRKEKYARAMERRVSNIEEEMRTLCRQEIPEETRRIRAARRRAENAEWSAALWRTVDIAAICCAAAILVMAIMALWTGAGNASAAAVRTEARPAVRILGEME